MNVMIMERQIGNAIKYQWSSRKEILKYLTQVSTEILRLLEKLSREGVDLERRICLDKEGKLEFKHVHRKEALSLINALNNYISSEFKDISVIFTGTNTLRDTYYVEFFQQMKELSEILDGIEKACKKLQEIKKKL